MSSLPQELLIISWPTMNRAEKVLAELDKLNSEHVVHLKYAVILVKDTHGKISEHVKNAPVTPGVGTAAGAIAGGLLGLLVQHLTPDAQKGHGMLSVNDAPTIGAAIGAGAGMLGVNTFEQIVPKDVVKAVEQEMAVKSSALVAVVHIDHLPQVLETLKAFPDGTIIRTTLEKGVVDQLAAAEKRGK